jgi:hypothetical protein
MKSKKSTRRRRIVAIQKHKSKSGKRHVSRKIRKSRSVRGGKISTGALVGTTALVGTGAYITYQQYQQNRKRTEIARAKLKITEITRALDAFNKLTFNTLVDVIETFKDFLQDAESIKKLMSKNVPLRSKPIFKPDEFILYQFSRFNISSLQGDLKISGEDEDAQLKNVLYQMVVWFIADCSFATYHIVTSIRVNEIWNITQKSILTVYMMIKYYLKKNTLEQFIQNYKTMYDDLQFTKFDQETERRRRGNRNIHTQEEEATMLFDEYNKYFKEPSTVCFNV